jgi:hypothetical protein
MFGKTNLLSDSYQTFHRCVLESELAERREARERAAFYTKAICTGLIVGAIVSTIIVLMGA